MTWVLVELIEPMNQFKRRVVLLKKIRVAILLVLFVLWYTTDRSVMANAISLGVMTAFSLTCVLIINLAVSRFDI